MDTLSSSAAVRRPLRGLATAASVLVWIAAVPGPLAVFLATLTFGSSAATGSAQAGMVLLSGGLLVTYLGSAVAGVVVLVWLWRARAAAADAGTWPQRWSQGWVVGGWLVPVLSLWVPAAIVSDVVRAGDPRADRLPSAVPTWWVTWLGGWVALGAGLVGVPLGSISLDARNLGMIYLWFSTLSFLAVVLFVVSAAAFTRIALHVAGWHDAPAAALPPWAAGPAVAAAAFAATTVSVPVAGPYADGTAVFPVPREPDAAGATVELGPGAGAPAGDATVEVGPGAVGEGPAAADATVVVGPALNTADTADTDTDTDTGTPDGGPAADRGTGGDGGPAAAGGPAVAGGPAHPASDGHSASGGYPGPAAPWGDAAPGTGSASTGHPGHPGHPGPAGHPAAAGHPGSAGPWGGPAPGGWPGPGVPAYGSGPGGYWPPPPAPPQPPGGSPNRSTWMVLAAVGVAAVAVVGIGVALIVADDPPADVAAAAVEDARQWSGARYRGTVPSYVGGSVEYDLIVTANGARGTVTRGGGARAEVVQDGDGLLLKGNREWWQQTWPRRADLFADIWVSDPGSETAAIDAILGLDPAELAGEVHTEPGSPWEETGERVVDGEPGTVLFNGFQVLVVMAETPHRVQLFDLLAAGGREDDLIRVTEVTPVQAAEVDAAAARIRGAESPRDFAEWLVERPHADVWVQPEPVCASPTCSAKFTVTNTGRVPFTGWLETTADGQGAGTYPIVLEPGQTTTFTSTIANRLYRSSPGSRGEVVWEGRVIPN